MIGTTISHYEITAELGRGGMGVVYKARDTRLNRDVALKFLADHLITDSASHDRFMQEARAAAALTHSNICTLYDVGEDEDKLFLVMEFVEGTSLKEVIDSGELEESRATGYALQIARGLERAHEAGIVHRDIKPANIMITPRGEAKIMDFGLAKLSGGLDLTKTGSTIGTALYMSPEQARGEPLGPESDMWSLGVVLFEMLTSTRPFEGGYEAALIYSILNVDPDIPSSISEDTRALLEILLSKSKDRRPDAESVTVSLSTGSSTHISAVPEARNKHTVAINSRLVIGLASIVLVLFSLWLFRDRPSSADDETGISMAVIPFGDLSVDGTNLYLGEGVAEALVSMLSGIGGIKTTPISTARSFTGSQSSLGELGDDLGVAFLLQGSIQTVGETIRLTMYLSDTASETELWRNQIDADLGDLFELQDSVAARVYRTVVDLFDVTTSQRPLLARGTENDEAYDLVLQGRFAYVNREPEAAIEFFDGALELDPNFAEAHARKAYAMVGLLNIGMVNASDIYDSIISHAERSLEINPNHPVALMALAAATGINFEFARSLEYGKRSFALDSIDVESINRYSIVLGNAGFLQQSLDLKRKQVREHPTDLNARFIYAFLASHFGYIDEARSSLEDALALQSTNVLLLFRLAETYALEGNYDRAIEILEPIVDQVPDPLFIYYLASYEGLRGNRDEVVRWLSHLEERRETGFVPFTVISGLNYHLGNYAVADSLLELAVDNREPWSIIHGLSFLPMEVLQSGAYGRITEKIVPGNPLALAEFNEFTVITNVAEVQAAAEALYGKQ